ncbi:ABC transporter ATP-binding protein [Lysinibacillus sp. RSDA_15]|uniref:ABC transporter ATP-binding protein n=1 Tax=Lysinibacillus TaxID=400634 RepID=UPI0018CFB943|nr:ATP-binding cassette domain-containing protein [Lysinibacillus sphaericus]MBG9754201.1 sugar ABC transporter ATP-binding protein [Lysinibacillus sphaericus]QTB15735.1 ATP-binding cassette domain-containing protein [Lysinibacillus sphaericus]
MKIIEVNKLIKEFTLVEKKAGFRGAIANLIRPRKKIIKSIDNITFSIKKGEIVGFLGPNGAGKSTTLKMLTGILNPTSGNVFVNGLSPQKNRKEVVKSLGVVFGQRTQLYWDLRLGETFELLKRIYQIDDFIFKKKLNHLTEILNMHSFINTPVRQLSLGQRMRGELAAALIHSPPLLFLDEPTIGLDIESKQAIREYIKEINLKEGTTVILTSHDIDDVSHLCQRLIVINHGKIVEDGPIEELIDKLSPFRELVIELFNDSSDLDHHLAEITQKEGLKVYYKFNRREITAQKIISDLAYLPIKDFSIGEPDLEKVIKEVYKKGLVTQ